MKNNKNTGIKFDEGKPLIGMVQKYFANSLLEMYKVATFGANKYGRDNWLGLKDAEIRYHDAKGRHCNAADRGEFNDPESNLPHLAHEAWNALALLELEIRKQNK